MLISLFAAAALQTAAMPDARWLEGCWEGEGLGAQVTECWMSAPDGRMTGMFQLLNADGSQRFSEILTIAHFEDGVALRLKHFNPDLTGWEARDEFLDWPLVEAGERRIAFRGLEFQLDLNDRLIILLDMRRGGEVVTERFTLERVEQGAP
ncbi:MAG: DUF6265 family protein [Oceanicaulis sp.]